MKALRIKEEIDLKGLRNYGYYRHYYSDNYQKNIECSPSSANWSLKTITKAIFIREKDRCIYYCTDEGDHHYQRFAKIDNECIKDIVEAGIVEEVEV